MAFRSGSPAARSAPAFSPAIFMSRSRLNVLKSQAACTRESKNEESQPRDFREAGRNNWCGHPSCLSPALLLMAHLKNILQGKLHDSGVHRTSDLPESIAIVQGRRIADRDASPDGGNSGEA